jgi:hypothetical protein
MTATWLRCFMFQRLSVPSAMTGSPRENLRADFEQTVHHPASPTANGKHFAINRCHA